MELLTRPAGDLARREPRPGSSALH